MVACHNEAPYLPRSLSALTSSLSGLSRRILVVADRCTDQSVAIARGFAEVKLKQVSGWKNSYAENLNIGFTTLIQCDFIAIVDADMVVPANFFDRAIAALGMDTLANSVSSALLTEPSSAYNSLYHSYEITMEGLGLNKRARKHGQRVFRGSAVRQLYREQGRVFSDAPNPDSMLDRETGWKVGVMGDVVVWSIRRTSLRRSMVGQMRQGRAQRLMDARLSSLLTEFLRFRPIVPLSFILSGSSVD